MTSIGQYHNFQQFQCFSTYTDTLAIGHALLPVSELFLNRTHWVSGFGILLLVVQTVVVSMCAYVCSVQVAIVLAQNGR